MTPGQIAELTPASVAFLLAHKDYPGCTMASLTIREHLEKIEAEVRAAHIDTLTAALREAVENEGTHPEYHRAVMAKHRREWPVLWSAIDAILAREHKHR